MDGRPMTVLELTNKREVTGTSTYYPFVDVMQPGFTTYDSFWTSTFGAPDDSVSFSTVINSVSETSLLLMLS